MENSGELIIYILLIIVFIVKGLFDSTKKKRQQKEILGQPGSDSYPEENSQDKDFWDIFEEKQQQEPAPYYRKREKTEKKRTVHPKTEKTFFQASKSSIGDNRAESTITSSIQLQEDITGSLATESFNNIEELRKAIIYTEILNRKY